LLRTVKDGVPMVAQVRVCPDAAFYALAGLQIRRYQLRRNFGIGAPTIGAPKDYSVKLQSRQWDERPEGRSNI
jgi:hypothetical protein